MKEWHEQIPPQGKMCKISYGGYAVIMPLSWQGYEDYACDAECLLGDDGEEYCIDDLTPLTADEMWQLMPWTDIKDAQIDEFVLIKWSNGEVSPHKISTLKNDCLAKIIGWIPLPKADEQEKSLLK